MTHLGHDFPQKLKLLTNAVSVFLMIVVFYILQYIFDMDFVCSCRPGVHINAIFYLMVPPLILTWVVHIMEPFHQTTISSIGHILDHDNIYWCLVKLSINYLSLSVVWTASVMFDGDWYVCLVTNLNVSQTGIPCKKDLTYEEYQIKAGHQTDSLDIGFGVICGFILAWTIAERISAHCIRKRTWKNDSVSTLEQFHPPYYRRVYEDFLAEQDVSKRTEEAFLLI
uniref:uncharacterized protein LOC124067563 n=1 Tax=Scatophagus argus TaxID=75038 RepID=UPI001ED8014E|nr:uncharacterized protein LOC124067563 [Scatophagus argus]